ncbi:hypothetical protein ICM05_01050 [Leucobacter sp. cx-42]|uniref:hypothetical protein n=1 Tax=unclassified Leucobacter TaxID=2621730 RepID=UPI00165D5F2E|nr:MULTISPECIES: hypothetical protein [unclassified Leucobacter]MBC9953235.1 hypothetical protein [Leucobacter sp. cx-42]
MTENTNTTAPVAMMSDADLDAAIAARNAAKAEERAASTRELSPRKPDDHQPKNGHMISFEFRGQAFEVDARYARDIRTGMQFKNGDIDVAISRMIGKQGFEDLLTLIADEEGFTDGEDLAAWFELFFEKAGAKN